MHSSADQCLCACATCPRQGSPAATPRTGVWCGLSWCLRRHMPKRMLVLATAEMRRRPGGASARFEVAPAKVEGQNDANDIGPKEMNLMSEHSMAAASSGERCDGQCKWLHVWCLLAHLECNAFVRRTSCQAASKTGQTYESIRHVRIVSKYLSLVSR